MSSLGVLFSFTEMEINNLRAQSTETLRGQYLRALESHYFCNDPIRLFVLGKDFWELDLIFRGGAVGYDDNPYPLGLIVLGGEEISAEYYYPVSVKDPVQVFDIANALETLDETAFKNLFDRASRNIPDGDYKKRHFYSLSRTQELSKSFWKLAAQEQRYVVFTADV